MISFLNLFIVVSFVASNVEGQCHTTTDKYIGDLCYSISNQKLGFWDAAASCHGANQDLAVIRTTLQANFLASQVRTQTSAPEGKFWIGLSRSSTSSRFQWDDGTSMYWSNFDNSLPKDDLYVAESTVNGKWQTLDGQQQLFFVCSYDPRGVQPSTPGYPTSGSPYTFGPYSTGFPASVPVSDSTGYPTGYPASQTPGYPVSDSTGSYNTGYPSFGPSDSTGFPASQTPGYPVSDSTGFPASQTPGYPVSDSTGFAASQTPLWPVSDSTGYPASQGPSDVPASGATWFPASQTPGYPASQGPSDGPYPVSDSTGSYNTGYPVSGATGGYPVSVTPQ